MLATRLAGLLPAMTDQEALEAAAVQSLCGRFSIEQWKRRAFRAPHHTASGVALVGGGSIPRPGEVSLAHYGILFLDELHVMSESHRLYAESVPTRNREFCSTTLLRED